MITTFQTTISPNMQTREQIITSMCYTYRHDFGLDKLEHDGPGGLISCGVTKSEREYIYRLMAQIFDNDIAPNMEFKYVEHNPERETQ